MIKNISKNELIKIFYQKEFHILLGFISVMSILSAYMYGNIRVGILEGTTAIDRYSIEVSSTFISLNALTFMKVFSTDFIFKSMIPYFVIFMTLFSIKIFSEDNTSGNLKNTLLRVSNKSNVYIGKAISLFILIILTIALNIIISFFVGALFFGIERITLKSLTEVLIIYFSASIPVFSFVLLIGTISIILPKNNIMTNVLIISGIIVSILDKVTITKHFSPLGIISLVAESTVYNISLLSLLQANIIPIIYICISLQIGKRIFKMKEWRI